MEAHRPPGHRRQLRAGRLDRARLAQRLPVQVGHLVRTDHPGTGIPGGDLGGLGGSQACGQGQRRFTVQRGFIHVRARAVEGQAQPLQQLAAVAGGGGQDQWHATIPGQGGAVWPPALPAARPVWQAFDTGPPDP
ncbi:hypothetical protein G6F23_013692 [Rhizopus arrhizus]|nr:hypothetical protein G6F23_013692 [Rhizopus arrhizus]